MTDGFRKTTIRLSPRARDYIATAAAREGVSFSQYVQEAALARAVYEGAVRGEPRAAMVRQIEQELHKLAEELKREARGG